MALATLGLIVNSSSLTPLVVNIEYLFQLIAVFHINQHIHMFSKPTEHRQSQVPRIQTGLPRATAQTPSALDRRTSTSHRTSSWWPPRSSRTCASKCQWPLTGIVSSPRGPTQSPMQRVSFLPWWPERSPVTRKWKRFRDISRNKKIM